MSNKTYHVHQGPMAMHSSQMPVLYQLTAVFQLLPCCSHLQLHKIWLFLPKSFFGVCVFSCSHLKRQMQCHNVQFKTFSKIKIYIKKLEKFICKIFICFWIQNFLKNKLFTSLASPCLHSPNRC